MKNSEEHSRHISTTGIECIEEIEEQQKRQRLKRRYNNEKQPLIRALVLLSKGK